MVKGSQNPRSYYKCSHAGCPAKKIVERDGSGDIMNTDYKVRHSNSMSYMLHMVSAACMMHACKGQHLRS